MQFVTVPVYESVPVYARHLNRHSPDCRSFWGIFRPVEARSKEIQSVTGCAGDQMVELAAAKGWSASRGLHQGTPRPPPLPYLLPLSLHAGAGGARSRAISNRISANSRRG
jgi:hypothetical protein